MVAAVVVEREHHSGWVLDAEGPAATEEVEVMRAVTRYDYSRYPPKIPRPIGSQPPVQGADRRKRCQTCNRLEHIHPLHVAIGSGPSAALRNVSPRPGGTGPVRASQPSCEEPSRGKPRSHACGRINIAAAYGNALLACGYPTVVAEDSIYHAGHYGEHLLKTNSDSHRHRRRSSIRRCTASTCNRRSYRRRRHASNNRHTSRTSVAAITAALPAASAPFHLCPALFLFAFSRSMGFASQSHSETIGGMVGPAGGEVGVSDIGAQTM